MITSFFVHISGSIDVYSERGDKRIGPVSLHIADLPEIISLAFAGGLEHLQGLLATSEYFQQTQVEAASGVCNEDGEEVRRQYLFTTSVASASDARLLRVYTEHMPGDLRDSILNAISQLKSIVTS